MRGIAGSLKISHHPFHHPVRLAFAVANQINTAACDYFADENRYLGRADFDGTDETR